MRVSLLSYKMPEMKGPEHGVFSKIPRHDHNYNRRYFDTTYKLGYENNMIDGNLSQKSSIQSAGMECGYIPTNKKRLLTKLNAEKFNNGEDPKYNTHNQRTWTNNKESAIRAVEDFNIDNTQNLILPSIDNELSLTLRTDKMFESIRSKSIFGCPKKKGDLTKSTLKIPDLRKY